MARSADLSLEQEQTVLRLLKFANISRDMERSREDGEFARDGGSIIYVIDENVFEMFIQPSEHVAAIETFYSEVWGLPGLPLQARRRYESQSALLASEHLVFGTLPGCGDDTLYMTPPHHLELAHRLEAMAEDLRRQLAIEPDKMVAALQAKIEVVGDLVRQKPRKDIREIIGGAAILDRDLTEDLAALKDSGAPKLVLDRVSTVRTAAEVLSIDRHAEPLDQLRRLVSPPSRHRIRGLKERYSYGALDKAIIDKDAAKWLRRLDRELARPENELRTRSQRGVRSRQALKNDAFSIAYLSWAARRAVEAGDRLIFITGDTILFDAYRRWYCDDLESTDEPFFVRRVSQYSPVLIPNDSGGDLSHERSLPQNRHSLFDTMQQAIESTLIPLVFSDQAVEPDEGGEEAAKRRDGVFSRRRERLALKLHDLGDVAADKELAEFATRISPEWIREQRDRLEEVQRLWQSTQRLVINASYDVLTSRLSPTQRALVDKLGDASAEQAAAALGEYAQAIMKTLLDDSVQLWLPLAKDFIKGELQEPGSAPSFQRLTLALDLEGQFHDRNFDTTGELIFAAAACHAIDLQDANNAHRFAMLAIRADETARSRNEGIPGLKEELQYLATVACRLLLCTVESHLEEGRRKPKDLSLLLQGVHQIKDIYLTALNLIHQAIRYHYDRSIEERGSDDYFHRVRYMRSLSERASLNLFMATTLGLSRAGIEGVGVGKDDSVRHLDLARGDLRWCALLDKGIPDGRLIDAVRAQYVPNVAGYEALAAVLHKGGFYKIEQWPIRALKRLTEFCVRASPHPLLKAELTAFFILSGRDGGPELNSSKIDYRASLRGLPLALDRALFRKVFSKIVRKGSRRRASRRPPFVIVPSAAAEKPRGST